MEADHFLEFINAHLFAAAVFAPQLRNLHSASFDCLNVEGMKDVFCVDEDHIDQ